MRKLMALLVTGMLVLSLGGCGKDARSLSGKITMTQIYEDASGVTDSSLAADEKVSEEAAAAQAKDGSAPEDQSEASRAKDENAQKDKPAAAQAKDGSAPADQSEAEKSGPENGSTGDAEKYTDGKIVRKTYLQESFGYRLVLDDDWEFATDKELEEQNQAVAEAAGDEGEFAQIVKNGDLFTDMMASNTMTGNTITVRLAQVGLADVVGKAEEREALLKEAMRADAEAAGLKKIETTSTEAVFLGDTVTAIGLKGELEISDDYKTEMWIRMVMKRKGEYASVIFVTGFTDFTGDNFQEILDKFERL